MLNQEIETVRVDLGDRSYDIQIGSGLLGGLGAEVGKATPARKLLLAYDSAVASPWMKQVFRVLSDAGYSVVPYEIPSGEKSKCGAEMLRAWDALAAHDFTRDSAVVALGGGVVGDLGGFIAASFLRGIACVQIPTTLLAMVDSSVGGKTGINLGAGKNLVGAFWQPSLVVADLDCLSTLPAVERNSGLAEVIKYGVIRDAAFFEFLEKNITTLFEKQNAVALRHVVKRSVEIKAEVVGKDERESGLRAILNFGHTIGHAVEAEAGYSALRHGEAIAIGMVAVSLLTLRRGKSPGWTTKDHDRLVKLIEAAQLPTRIPSSMTTAALIDRTRVDKKAKAGQVRYVLPVRMGEVEVVKDVTDEQVAGVLKELRGK